MNSNIIAKLTVRDLKRMVSIRERIESLEKEMGKILGKRDDRGTLHDSQKGKRGMSAAGRASVAAAMKARWRKAKRAGRNTL